MEEYGQLPLESQYLAEKTPDEVNAIIAAISRERLNDYLGATNSDVEALALYEYNARLANCLHELIGGLEIALRNGVSRAIIAHYGREDWYRCRAFTKILMPERRANIREVRMRLKAQNQAERSGRVVAGLTFHFWVAMHEAKYRDLIWTPYLHRLWPAGTNITHVHKDLLKIRDLRNRIAHHEPIFRHRWRRRSELIWTRLAQLAPDKHAWFSDRLEPALDSILAALDDFENIEAP